MKEGVPTTEACPCGSGEALQACCGPLLEGKSAPTAEALMRSRYTAYVRGDIEHIRRTNASELDDVFDAEQSAGSAEDVTWTSLTIVDVAGGGPEDETGRVEFRARFKRLGQHLEHHEAAIFHRENGRWVYAEAQMNPKTPPRRVEKVCRNDPCPCGSGKKFKKCCG
jgi:SEC-C motif-containing protein